MTDSVEKVEELRKASAEGNLDVVKKLIDEGVDINSSNEFGMTAVMAAVCRFKRGTVDFLVRNGADVNQKNVHGRSAVSMADENTRKVIFNAIKEMKENKKIHIKDHHQER
jgi:ankyrin repeat protein